MAKRNANKVVDELVAAIAELKRIKAQHLKGIDNQILLAGIEKLKTDLHERLFETLRPKMKTTKKEPNAQS